MLCGGTTVNDSETIGRTNGVNHRQSTSVAERFVHLCEFVERTLCLL
nr:MAG TPA_asm: hypothetical protein [Bacteriophage sp.]